jgi:threonine/homoserine/homoserine lactone efflux protein
MAELLLGISIGLGAGVSPGPLLTLVISTSLQRGFGAGLRVACSPLLTDGPIIAVTLLFLSTVPDALLAAFGVAGGLFMISLGLAAIHQATSATLQPVGGPAVQRDLWQGMLVNTLSPHPWLFWLSVGGPILVAAWSKAPPRAAAFLVGFYLCLIGAKIVLAGVVAAGRHRLSDAWYRRLLTGAGGLMMAAGVLLLIESIQS